MVARLAQLEAEKAEAVATEDYGRAKELKVIFNFAIAPPSTFTSFTSPAPYRNLSHHTVHTTPFSPHRLCLAGND